jgi:hypothetical protein
MLMSASKVRFKSITHLSALRLCHFHEQPRVGCSEKQERHLSVLVFVTPQQLMSVMNGTSLLGLLIGIATAL